MLFKVAWRNIWRSKRRSLITALSVGFGLWMALVFTGVGNYSYMGMIDNSAKMGFGHVSLLHPDYLENPSLKKTVRLPVETLDQIRQIEGVVSINSRVVGQAIAQTAGKSFPAQVVAVDIATEDMTTVVYESIKEGEVFAADSKRHAIVGSKLAAKLGLKLGRKFVYTVTDKHGEMASGLLRVKGIFTTGAPEVDGYLVMLPLHSMRETLGYEQDEQTVLSVLLADNRESSPLAEEVRSVIKNDRVAVYPWFESQPDLAGFIAVDRGSAQIFLGFVVLLVGLGVLNTMLTAVMERKREFGIMLAIGMAPMRLVGMILCETLVLCVVGFVIGAFLTVPFHLYLVEYGIDFSEWIKDGASAGGAVYEPLIRSRIFVENVVWSIVGLTGLAILASLYPAFKASRIPPVESIRDLT